MRLNSKSAVCFLVPALAVNQLHSLTQLWLLQSMPFRQPCCYLITDGSALKTDLNQTWQPVLTRLFVILPISTSLELLYWSHQSSLLNSGWLRPFFGIKQLLSCPLSCIFLGLSHTPVWLFLLRTFLWFQLDAWYLKWLCFLSPTHSVSSPLSQLSTLTIFLRTQPAYSRPWIWNLHYFWVTRPPVLKPSLFLFETHYSVASAVFQSHLIFEAVVHNRVHLCSVLPAAVFLYLKSTSHWCLFFLKRSGSCSL